MGENEMRRAGVAVMFPGQGAHTAGLGMPWREHRAWTVVERAEEATGQPLAPLLLGDAVKRTRESQLSVLLASLMAWEAVRPSLQDEVVAFAGHSLGQITALIAAGVLPFDEGIRFALRRAEATQAAVDARPGRMAALLGATDEQREAAAAVDGCWIANDNAPGQLVVAGTPEGVDAGVGAAKAAGLRKAIPLEVDGAFHTPLMAAARDALAPVIGAVAFGDGAAPVVSNGDAAAHSGGAGWSVRLLDHLVEPVRWRDSLVTLARTAEQLVEVGPGALLAGMTRRTVPESPVRSVATPDDVAQLLEVV